MMAMSVNRRIERTLPNVMGQRDPEAMIRVRSADPIRASGLVPRSKAGHMTASDLTCRNAEKTLASRGPSTQDDNVYGVFLAGQSAAGVPDRRLMKPLNRGAKIRRDRVHVGVSPDHG